MIKLYGYKLCPYAQGVLFFLKDSSIKYEVEYISLKNKPKWFLEISPNSKVPIIQTKNKTVLFESSIIFDYLNKEYDLHLLPKINEEEMLMKSYLIFIGNLLLTQFKIATGDKSLLIKLTHDYQTFSNYYCKLSCSTNFLDYALIPFYLREYSNPLLRLNVKEILENKLANICQNLNITLQWINEFKDEYLSYIEHRTQSNSYL